MLTQHILECRDKSILVAEDRPLKTIVVAAPHHAPLGVAELPCEEHEDADENTGLLAHYTAQLLDCCSIIACNYYIDSNKDENSDYFKKLLAWNPKILVELHGHGGSRANFDIEISSGNQGRNAWSVKLASALAARLEQTTTLKDYTICGDYNKIYFKASKSNTITSKRWIPFHIELPESLRAHRSQYTLFCELLAETLREIVESIEYPVRPVKAR